ncbi:MAG: 1,4-alpha-glucan branching protein GlgB [Arenicellales bacterium]
MTNIHPLRDEDVARLLEARLHDPFRVLGRHTGDGGRVHVLVFNPQARSMTVSPGDVRLAPVGETGLFQWTGGSDRVPPLYRVRWIDRGGRMHEQHDPYAFPPLLREEDLWLFAQGTHHEAHRFMGAHIREIQGVPGVHFAVWAPNAERVSVIGDFNDWDGRRHPMRAQGASGVWELFVPEVEDRSLYKYEIRNRSDGSLHVKSDPYGRRFEVPPRTAGVVTAGGAHVWQDEAWMRHRPDWQHQPISIYEVHLGSWRRSGKGAFLDYRTLAHRLVDYLLQTGFTHVQLMPVMEHPFDASWGYQTTGYFAPTSRFGEPDDLRYLVDHCHSNGIGVYLDWVPGHFPRDPHGLARFDGTSLYEHADLRRGLHPEWDTLVFNYGRNEVRSFLISSALYWLKEFHTDGLRVDAVASMLYLDYARKEGEWLPNEFGGRENLEAVSFLRELNTVTHGECPGTVTIAEESTSWPAVSRPVRIGGLGFSMKWNMGWMHDTLLYMRKDPVHRHFHHDMLTFGMLYTFHENFVLPLSHDEVVHGKSSLLGKMPGDEWQRFANLRLLYTYMYTYPGKKHLFMGDEFAAGTEWNHDRSLEWGLLRYKYHAGMQLAVGDLNRLYRELPALHRHDFEPMGFDWIDCHDAAQSVISYLRRGADQILVVVLNFTPVPRHGYRIGVPEGGYYRELFNSDSESYGGSNLGNLGTVRSRPVPWMGRPHSLELTLPPLAGLVLRREQRA